MTLGTSQTFSASSLANDADGDALSFTFLGNPSAGSTSGGSNAPAFTYIAPPANQAQTSPQSANVDFTISDGQGGTASGTMSIRLVDPVTTTPTTTPISPTAHDIPRGRIRR